MAITGGSGFGFGTFAGGAFASNNPDLVLKPNNADLNFTSTAPSISISNVVSRLVPSADLVLSETAPNVSLNFLIKPPSANLFLSETAPSVVQTFDIRAAKLISYVILSQNKIEVTKVMSYVVLRKRQNRPHVLIMAG